VHFGNFGRYEWRLRTVWVIMGFAPPLLFVTGAIMWWNRKIQPGLRRAFSLGKARQDSAPAVPISASGPGRSPVV
jgi:uncharacterized iron-regulated membrane protein